MITKDSLTNAQNLRKLVQELKEDLSVLEPQLLDEKEGMYITYSAKRDNSRLIVYAPLRYKAYVPTKYKGFTVEFNEYNSQKFDFELEPIEKSQ